MTIWILTILFVAGGAAAGRQLGATRCIFLTLGIIAATFLAVPLGEFVKPIVRLGGITGLAGQTFVAPFAVYCAVLICFSLLGHAIYQKIDLYYKYKTTDEKCVTWQRMHIHTGLALGLLMGITLLISVATAIYGAGYMTRQVVPSEGGSALGKFVSSAHEGLRKTGLEKLAASVNPYPERWYNLADSIGLVYNNPQLKERLLEYPAFLNYAENAEFQKLVANTTLNDVLAKKKPAGQFFANTNLLAFITKPAVNQQLKSIDLKDLKAYLETGKSEMYNGDKIIGKWEIDLPATIPQVTRAIGANMQAAGLLRRMLIQAAYDVTMVATPDGQLTLKGNILEFPQLTAIIGGRSPGKLNIPAPPQPGQPLPAPKNMATGNWKREGDVFKITLANGDNKSEITGQTHTDDVILLTFDKGALAFTKME